ncbi:MAG: hypothetical protein JO301_16560 [Chitinophagaceae bacterium]|nr:hypothetical protein [Chitinophagaceae bacterium]
MDLRRLTILFCLFLFLYSCTKNTEVIDKPARLVKVLTNGADSIGNYSSKPLIIQQFTYDQNGALIQLEQQDLGWRNWYTGPTPLRMQIFIKPALAFDADHHLLKIGVDSLAYVNGRVTERYTKSYPYTSPYFRIRSYTYDANGHISAVGFYGQQQNPSANVKMNQWDFTYNADGNIPVSGYTFDKADNPYRSLGLLAFYIYDSPELLNRNNQITPGFTYKYDAAGRLIRISNIDQGNEYYQEFYYE